MSKPNDRVGHFWTYHMTIWLILVTLYTTILWLHECDIFQKQKKDFPTINQNLATYSLWAIFGLRYIFAKSLAACQCNEVPFNQSHSIHHETAEKKIALRVLH